MAFVIRPDNGLPVFSEAIRSPQDTGTSILGQSWEYGQNNGKFYLRTLPNENRIQGLVKRQQNTILDNRGFRELFLKI